MHESRVKYFFISIVLAAVLGLVGYGFLLSGVIRHSETASGFSEQLEQEVVRESRLRTLGNLIDEVSEDRSFLSTQFVSSEEDAVVAYIRLLESLPRYAPVTFDILSVEAVGDPTKDGTLRARVRATGSATGVKQLLLLIEALPVVTTIDEADISVASAASGTTQWQAQLVLHALVLE